MSAFQSDQLVIVNDSAIGGSDELGYVIRKIPLTATGYEIVLLKDHKPGEDLDMIRCTGGSNMRLATMEEIEDKRSAWEKQNAYPLSMEIVAIGSGYAVTG